MYHEDIFKILNLNSVGLHYHEEHQQIKDGGIE